MNSETPIKTKDGSHTLFSEAAGEHYHSVFGAVQESEHIFIRAGLVAKPAFPEVLQILEIGFGTGLNALLSLQWAEKHRQRVQLKSFYGDDEKILLEEFAQLLSKHYNTPASLLCGHNGKEFDFPYLARRMLINGIPLPSILDLAGKKPWEIRHLDTLELWKFGDYKHYTSLELLAAIFDIPTPKDDIDGSQVAKVYWEDKDLERIAAYCQKDVLTTLQLFRRYQGLPLVKEEFVVVS